MLPRKAPKNASATAGAPVEGRDAMSNLPDGVLQHVLSFLPAQDVVRTCVLAKRWRHMWESTTVLRFVCGGSNKLEFVDHLLLQRISGDTPLDTCDFDLGEIHEHEKSRIILWIRIALQCKVRVLQLSARFDSCSCLDYPISRPQDNHPTFASKYLKKLELYGLDDEIMHSRFLDFSYCPILEDLKIDDGYLCCTLLISSQSLKHLTIIHCRFGDDRRMAICAPNLVSLFLQVDNGRTPSLQKMSSLLTAYVKIDGYYDKCLDDDYSNQSIVLQGLSEVRNLYLTARYQEVVVFRRDLKFCSTFNKLKSLILDEYWCEPDDFSDLACLLKLCPVLEKLTLQLYSEEPEHKVEIKLSCKPLEMSAAISQHLKTIEVKCEVYDERLCKVLTFLSKLHIWFQFSG